MGSRSRCSIRGCTTAPGNFAYFKPPTANEKLEERRIWFHNIGTTKANNQPTIHSKVCYRHFVDDKPTSDNPFPVLNMGHDDVITKKDERTNWAKSRSTDQLLEEILAMGIDPKSERAADIVERDRQQPPEALSQSAPRALWAHDYEFVNEIEKPAPIIIDRDVRTPPARRVSWPTDPTTPNRRREIESNRKRRSLDDEQQPSTSSSDPKRRSMEIADDDQPSTSSSNRSIVECPTSATIGLPTTSTAVEAIPIDDQMEWSDVSDDEANGGEDDDEEVWHDDEGDYDACDDPIAAMTNNVSTQTTGACLLDWSIVGGSDQLTKRYTGMPKKEAFIEFFELIRADAEYLSLKTPEKKKTKNYPRKLDLRNEYLITLMRLRRNFDNRFLADLFNIDESSVSRIIGAWIPFLAEKLRPWVSWIPRRDQSRRLPACYAPFPNVVGIIDCFELVVERSGSSIQRQYFWSEYKHNYTVKFLVCIAPNTTIMHISPAWGGRTSDIHIVENDSEFLHSLRPGDVLLADKGFDLDEYLYLRWKTHVQIPKFLSAKTRIPHDEETRRRTGIEGQFTAKDVEMNRQLSAARIHVERAIGQLRYFKVLAQKCPATLLPFISDIAIIAAAIINMSPPILK